MPKWNEQQLKAIHTKEKNILVSASAGSGKTTVLIARLMDLVMVDHVAIESILAMTFTEAAANEMKKRLASELQQAYQNAQNDEEKSYITKQLTSIQTSHISTIHSFCLSIIQEYYYVIGLDAKRISHIMDNGLMVQYHTIALQQAFDQQYKKQDPIFLRLTQMFSARPENDHSLESLIMNLATLSSSKSDADAWLSSLSQAYQDVQRFEDLPAAIYENFFEYLFVEEQRYEETLLKIDELFKLKYHEEVKKHTLVQKKCLALKDLRETLQASDYEAFRSAFLGIAHVVVPTSPDKEDKEYLRLRKEVQSLEDAMISLLFSEDDFMKDMRMLYPYITKIVEMCRDYQSAYAQIKFEKAVIDFDDMEHFALAILQANNGQVADIYRTQFVEIMVDEFQDSNDVQNKLVTLICRENNVFRVGDIKQSIYGFRHAKPQLMKGLITDKGEHDDVIYLSNNYRSKKMIVEFNNELFKRLMNIEGFSCSYEKEDDVETGVPAQSVDNVPICFHAVYHDEIKAQEHLLISKNDLKASYIANQIQKIKEKEQRQWKDFVVLVRGNARKDNMKAIFDELHIPYFIDIKYGFYQSNAVQIMLSTLRCMYQPHDDIHFVATMLSPLFQRTTQELAEIKLKKEADQSYYDYYRQHPFADFYILEEFIDTLHKTSLTSMLNKLYNIQHYYSEHTTMQEKTNLDLLFEKAVQFEEDYASGIAAFLSQIEQIKDAQTAEAIPIGSEADVVRVMSIHQSKGLQFPVVFLWSTDKQTPIEFKEFCITDSEVGIGMKAMDLPQRYVRTTLSRIAMEHKKDKEELEEEMRILYVATTRAQQQMHIVDCVLTLDTYHQPLTMSSIYNRKGYTSWILQAFLQEPCPLFTIKEVHSLWTSVIQETTKEPYKKIPTYQQPVSTLQLTTASAGKEQTLPEFRLDQSTFGSDYGTKMHTLIEHLSASDWTTSYIQEIAQTLSMDLHPHDVQTLYTLGQHPIYQKGKSGEYYHELPFMVKDREQILHGYMDFVSIDGDMITIIDYKTDALDNAFAFLEQYQAQLEIYKKAMHILYPKSTITCYIYALHTCELIQVKERKGM